uniref:Zonadhesin n=1 Tax=Trichobilharzia regenti TaxID=157069 RepID=A0AA85KBN0_TRIRE|nr:unnamed protein product [Trichobilharzia regenti]
MLNRISCFFILILGFIYTVALDVNEPLPPTLPAIKKNEDNIFDVESIISSYLEDCYHTEYTSEKNNIHIVTITPTEAEETIEETRKQEEQHAEKTDDEVKPTETTTEEIVETTTHDEVEPTETTTEEIVETTTHATVAPTETTTEEIVETTTHDEVEPTETTTEEIVETTSHLTTSKPSKEDVGDFVADGIFGPDFIIEESILLPEIIPPTLPAIKKNEDNIFDVESIISSYLEDCYHTTTVTPIEITTEEMVEMTSKASKSKYTKEDIDGYVADGVIETKKATKKDEVKPTETTTEEIIQTTTDDEVKPTETTTEEIIQTTTDDEVKPTETTTEEIIQTTTDDEVKPTETTTEEIIQTTTDDEVKPTETTTEEIIQTTTDDEFYPKKTTTQKILKTTTDGKTHLIGTDNPKENMSVAPGISSAAFNWPIIVTALLLIVFLIFCIAFFYKMCCCC